MSILINFPFKWKQSKRNFAVVNHVLTTILNQYSFFLHMGYGKNVKTIYQGKFCYQMAFMEIHLNYHLQTEVGDHKMHSIHTKIKPVLPLLNNQNWYKASILLPMFCCLACVLNQLLLTSVLSLQMSSFRKKKEKKV